MLLIHTDIVGAPRITTADFSEKIIRTVHLLRYLCWHKHFPEKRSNITPSSDQKGNQIATNYTQVSNTTNTKQLLNKFLQTDEQERFTNECSRSIMYLDNESGNV